MIEHEQFLKQAIELARQARADGDHPFGALLELPMTSLVKPSTSGSMKRASCAKSLRALQNSMRLTDNRGSR